MSNINYSHPPITEAVIGITLDEAAGEEAIEKMQQSFAKEYPNYSHQVNHKFNLMVRADNGNASLSPPTGAIKIHKRASNDITESLVIYPDTYIFSQLAPYPGWEVYFERFKRDWKKLKRLMGFRTTKRIGVRFINRIDIPAGASDATPDQYIKIYPKVPEVFGKIGSYAVQYMHSIDDIGCILRINSASIPSPLLDNVSYLVDLDISKESDVPQSDEDIFNLIDKIRVKKNVFFEASIGDAARELFNDRKLLSV